MLNVSIQVKKLNTIWDNTPKTFQAFTNWSDVSTFAYRLALKENKEVRIEHKGNGNYYSPQNAANFLGI